MIKHAYCIIAHTDVYTLNTLIDCIDDERNDIFLLLDKKSKIDLFRIQRPINCKLLISRDVDVRWGDISQIRAEISVFRSAFEHGEYDYYHLLSGQDLPLHSQDYIHEYFSTLPRGANLIGFAQGEFNKADLEKKLSEHTLFTRHLRDCSLKGRVLSKFRDFYLAMQKRYSISLKKLPPQEYKKGCNWASLSNDFVGYILSKEKELVKTYKGTICSDEMYKQTLIWNSPYRDTLPSVDNESVGSMREIDWTRGAPYVFRTEDFDALIKSERLFARKFDSRIDKSIIDKISAQVKGMRS